MNGAFYKVYIACMTKNPDGFLTKDYMLAKQLYRKLEQKGIHTFLIEKCNPNDRTEAIDSADILIVAGTCTETLLSDAVSLTIPPAGGWTRPRNWSFLRSMPMS